MANNEASHNDLAYAHTHWKAADALRGQVDAEEYKHVVLGLLFLKYVSDSFESRRDERPADTFLRGQHPDLKADFVLGDSPFNVSDWGGGPPKDDHRWRFGRT